jgi:hypothetical protein
MADEQNFYQETIGFFLADFRDSDQIAQLPDSSSGNYQLFFIQIFHHQAFRLMRVSEAGSHESGYRDQDWRVA